jgi:ribonuclease Z
MVLLPRTWLTLVSGIGIHIPGSGNIILDCGEGTLGTIKRTFSPVDYVTFFQELQTIYISHLHADHHLDLTPIIKEFVRHQSRLPLANRHPLFLIAPWRLIASLYEFNQVEPIGLEDYLVPFSAFHLIPQNLLPLGMNRAPHDLSLFYGFLSTMNLHAVDTCLVPHCAQAYGIAITHKSGWKIVYSGDCRPSGDLAQIGRDATLCIHEGTIANSMMQEALEKMHCTTDEAVGVGRRMRAKYTLLTHFSQRWHRVPEFVLEWQPADEEKYHNVGIAFDRMKVRLGDMWKLPLMLPAFERLYSGERERKRWVKMQESREKKRRAVLTETRMGEVGDREEGEEGEEVEEAEEAEEAEEVEKVEQVEGQGEVLERPTKRQRLDDPAPAGAIALPMNQ